MDFLKGLNAQQREAVNTIDGPLLILAGAGSGKTRVITHRIAHIITSRHVVPSAVLAVTFTNKAAREMRERVAALLEDVPLDSMPTVCTFHSFCVRMLRRDGDPLVRVRPGFTRRFLIYDDEDQLQIIKAAYRRARLRRKGVHAVPRGAAPKSATPRTPKSPRRICTRTRSTRNPKPSPRSTRNTKKPSCNANALDFDDLLLEAVRLLRTDDATRGSPGTAAWKATS